MNNAALCKRNSNPFKGRAWSRWRFWVALWRRWSKNSGSRRRLAELDSHLLKDIGLTRAEALQEISKPFWED